MCWKVYWQIYTGNIFNKTDGGFIKENEIGKIIEEFDLKKAIIYSEIIDPKYFKIQKRGNQKAFKSVSNTLFRKKVSSISYENTSVH